MATRLGDRDIGRTLCAERFPNLAAIPLGTLLARGSECDRRAYVRWPFRLDLRRE